MLEKSNNFISKQDDDYIANYIREDFACCYNDETEILSNSIKEFETGVKFIVQNFANHNHGKEKSIFELFDPADKSFFDMLTLEKRMERCISDNLVLDTIRNLFKFYNIKYLWPYSNKTIDKNASKIVEYPLAFIVCDGKYRIGYRLSNAKNVYEENELKRYIEHYNIQRVEIIIFGEKVKEHKCSGLGVPMQEITIEDFFNRYFSLKNYEKYIIECKEKVKWANNYLGFHVISSLTNTNKTNYEIRRSVADILNENPKEDSNKMQYKKIKEDSTNPYYNEYVIMRKYVVRKEEFENIKHRIEDNKMINCLLGNNDCAQSLISSEYLYNAIINKSNISALQNGENSKDFKNYGFDFTVIACGYLKSIEQFLYIIFNMYTEKRNDEYYVGDGDGKKSLNLEFINNRKVEKEFKVSKKKRPSFRNKEVLDLGNLIYFMHLNIKKEHYFFDENSEKVLFGQLLQFSQECRNGYSHKDNIEKLNILEDVRNNSFYLLKMILGGYNFESINPNYKNYFMYHNFDYEKVYMKLYEYSGHIKQYSILFDSKIIDVHINEKLSEPIFDKNGFLIYKNIVLYNDKDNSQIIIDENNIPKQIWFIKRGKERERVEILW